ncbi:Uncharacterised protein [Mycobacteroides abscessus subsp. abscessus]|nr:Uncharacterised protein [Mycobacteroides abscessus subsp. abscessus]
MTPSQTKTAESVRENAVFSSSVARSCVSKSTGTKLNVSGTTIPAAERRAHFHS